MAKGLRKDHSRPDIDLVELDKVSSRLTSKVCMSYVCLSRSRSHPFTHFFRAKAYLLSYNSRCHRSLLGSGILGSTWKAAGALSKTGAWVP